jgi:hypothetical protein
MILPRHLNKLYYRRGTLSLVQHASLPEMSLSALDLLELRGLPRDAKLLPLSEVDKSSNITRHSSALSLSLSKAGPEERDPSNKPSNACTLPRTDVTQGRHGRTQDRLGRDETRHTRSLSALDLLELRGLPRDAKLLNRSEICPSSDSHDAAAGSEPACNARPEEGEANKHPCPENVNGCAASFE